MYRKAVVKSYDSATHTATVQIVGSLAVWDNRTTQHFAVNDYHGARRRMHRMTIEGEIPV